MLTLRSDGQGSDEVCPSFRRSSASCSRIWKEILAGGARLAPTLVLADNDRSPSLELILRHGEPRVQSDVVHAELPRVSNGLLNIPPPVAMYA